MFSDSGTLDKFGAILSGVGAAAAIAAGGPVGAIGGVAIAAGAMQIGCGGLGLVLDRLRGRRADAPAVIQRHLKALKANWQEWSGHASMKDPDAQARAVRCFEDYFQREGTDILPRSEQIMKLGRDPLAVAGEMLKQAAANAKDCYGDTAENALTRSFFRKVTEHALTRLLNDPDFTKLVEPAFQGSVVSALSRIEAMVTDLWTNQQAMPLLTAQKLAQRFGAEADLFLDHEKIAPFLEARAQEFADLKARLEAPTNEDDPVVQRLRSEASKLIEEGDFEGADAKLAEAEARDEEMEREEEERLARRKRSRARSRSERGDLARMRLNYRAAADHYAAAARIVATDDEARWAHELRRAGVLSDLGREFGDNAALEEAVQHYRETVLPLAPRGNRPDDWAGTQNNFGNALATLGQRESGTARLEQAVAAYRAALQEWTRDRMPLDWATTQNNLGNALATLGARESGTARLEQAVAAYRAALQERTRDRVPLDWAMTQNNLGNALRILGQRESGTARLEQAVAAYRAALEEWTRDQVPLDWAKTQNNLGNALATLGQRESGTARLEQALDAYRAALEEWTRDRVPLDWATTQNNLGNALSTLGERERGTALPEQAVAAYRAALEERMRERVPLDWAMTQGNLGNVYLAFFQKDGDPAHLDTAQSYVEAALEVFREAGATHYAAMAEDQLAKIAARRAAE